MGKSGKAGDRNTAQAAGVSLEDTATPFRGVICFLLTRRVAAYVLLAVGLVLTVLVSFGAWRQSRSKAEDQFLARTEEIRSRLAQEIDRHTRLLRSARAVWTIKPHLTRDDWRLYVEKLDLPITFPDLKALGFIERVPSTNLAGFLDSVRGGGASQGDFPGFHVHPDSTNAERYIVRFVEPLTANASALGYDIGTETNRRAAAEAARDKAGPVMTRKITLVQATNAPGMLVLLPVYDQGIQVTNLALRCASLRGWVYAAFVVEDFVSQVCPSNGEDVSIEIYDAGFVSPSHLLYPSRNPEGRGEIAAHTSFERVVALPNPNCLWTLRIRAGDAFASKPWLSAPGYLDAAVLGLCISFLVFGIVKTLASTGQRAQQLANEMTAKLRLQNHAMACARNGIFILDAVREDYPIIYANPAFEKLTCYSVNGTLGKDTVNLLRDQVNRGDIPGTVEFHPGGQEGLSVVREYHRDGSRHWVDFRLVPVTDERGRKTHYLGIVEDVTDRKRAEKELAKAEQRYHEMVDNLNVGVYRNTPGATGRFLEVNPAAVAMFEAGSREELMDCSVSDLYVDPTRRLELSERILREGSVKDAELELHTLKGRIFWAAITATMRRDAAGGVFFDGIIVDITERKQAETALRESQERFALAVQGTNDGIWDWNVVTNEVYFSPRWKAMLGYDEQEIQSNFAAWERLLHPDDRARSLVAIQEYFAGRTPTYELEHRLRHKDGTYRWILARGVARRDADGRPLRMAGSHVDLTARKQAEERLQQAYEELAQSQRTLKDTLSQLQASHEELQRTQLQLIQAAKMESIGTLAAGVAHEVKNPLQTILIGLDYLGHSLPAPSENIEMALGDMRDAVWRANNIIKELLQLSADTAFVLAEADLNAVVNRSLWLMNSELVATKTNVVCHLESGLPPVRMDIRKMEQVLLNLLINAVQAMAQQGTLFISTQSGRLAENLELNGPIASHFAPDERLVVAEIRDTGPGIAPAHLARIFDPFFTTKPVGKGTGLGLSIVKKIVDLHDGSVEVRNATEGGVVVTLAFRAGQTERG
jgi:PAS domain S-box-containing protein